MNKIKELHTNGPVSYFYTEKMKKDGLVFVLENHEEEYKELSTTLELVVVKNDNATVYYIYQGDYRSKIEIYMMVKLIVDQYEKDDFWTFVDVVASGRMGTNMQSEETSKREVYSWLYGRFNNFLYSCN